MAPGLFRTFTAGVWMFIFSSTWVLGVPEGRGESNVINIEFTTDIWSLFMGKVLVFTYYTGFQQD